MSEQKMDACINTSVSVCVSGSIGKLDAGQPGLRTVGRSRNGNSSDCGIRRSISNVVY